MSSYHSQEQTLAQLPTPSAEEISHSNRLIERVVNCIKQEKGVIAFSDYMQAMLYTPGLGYYSAGLYKFGEQGDFVTAPEISPLFGRCLAMQCQQLFDQGCANKILEFGAGSGRLCQHILEKLEKPVDYYILEVSADLRDRQQQLLRDQLPFEQLDRVTWLEELPGSFNGVVIANEVLDAMPASMLRKSKEWFEMGVGFDGRAFCWQNHATESKAVDAILAVEEELGSLPEGYQTEINLNYGPWFQALSKVGNQVVVLLIDYGYERAHYYHAERYKGTLLCHYHHRAHDDPFILPGLQDITVSVDFDAVADAAQASGFETIGLNSQAQFLLANGLLEEAGYRSTDADTVAQLDTAQQIKMLTLPEEMGERFKVIGFQKNLEIDVPALAMRR